MEAGGLIKNWTRETSDQYGRVPVLLSHDLHQRSMFSDDGQASLLDRYPRDRLGVYTMGNDPQNWRTFVRGDAGNLSGEALLKAVKTGRFWLNLRAVNEHLEDYDALKQEMFSDFDARTGQRSLKQDLGVLISSPNAQVFYHLDIPLVLLWQIRGVKRVWIYPESPEFAPDTDIESVVLRETEEEFEYQPGFDDNAWVVDLEPGMLANWPQNAPHRIENQNMLNVSLSVEYLTMPAIARANMLYYNGFVRRRFGANPDRRNDVGARMWIKAIAARALKLAGKRNAYQKASPVRFRVDPEIEGGDAFLPESEMA